MPANSISLNQRDFLRDTIQGLSAEQKYLCCKYFYDQQGSRLFDRICELPEYYLTRTELSIMESNIDSIAYQIAEEVMLVEYGSGSSVKTRHLLDALINPIAYVPVDISEKHLLDTARELQSAYPSIEVLPVVADFVSEFALPRTQQAYSHVAVYFPGSTIGNFEPEQAGRLLENMASRLGKQGGLLIGIDLQKDPRILELAYDDPQGITARFNLNLLTRINRELGGNFALEKFRHQATYNEFAHRIEISIVSQEKQTVEINDKSFHFEAGEEILTEYSHKYTVDGFAELAKKYGFGLHQHWTDENNYFAVLHLVLEN